MSSPILRSGSSGPSVKELQTLLNQKLQPSPNLAVDGQFGAATHSAVDRFQKSKWLVVDGEVGPCTWAALRGTEAYETLHDVTLVPQIDTTACWLAATSMLLRQSIPRSAVPAEFLASDGGLLNDSELAAPANTVRYARHFHLRMHYPQSWTATGLAGVLRSGPASSHVLWNISGYVNQTGSSGHFVVIAGIRGDGTEIGTTLRIYDPWPPTRGTIASHNYMRLMMGTPGFTYQLFQR